MVGTELDVSGEGRSLARPGVTSGTGELLVAWIARHVIQDAGRPRGGAGGAGAGPRRGRHSRALSGPCSVLAAGLRREARLADALSFARLRSPSPWTLCSDFLRPTCSE